MGRSLRMAAVLRGGTVLGLGALYWAAAAQPVLAQQASDTDDTQVVEDNGADAKVTVLQRLIIGAGQAKVAIDTP